MKNLLELTYNEETFTFHLTIDGKDAGFLEKGEGSDSCRQIGHVEIKEEFKGKGLYRLFIAAILQTSEVEQFYSDNRNYESNPVWEHWTGEQLEYDTMCYVDVNPDGTLDFMTEEN